MSAVRPIGQAETRQHRLTDAVAAADNLFRRDAVLVEEAQRGQVDGHRLTLATVVLRARRVLHGEAVDMQQAHLRRRRGAQPVRRRRSSRDLETLLNPVTLRLADNSSGSPYSSKYSIEATPISR